MRRIAMLITMAVLACGCSTNRVTEIDEPSTLEGLQRVEVKGLDVVYRKPDADLGKYRRLLVRDVDIAFSRGWERDQTAIAKGGYRVDTDRIKRELAKLFAEVARDELESKGGYELVNEPGPDVLEVRPSIIDLYINAPDVSRDNPGRVRSYTTSAGRMTLIAELRDSVSGEILARAYDRREDMRSTWWEWTTSITNSQKARIAIRSWASILRETLDRSREDDRLAAK